MVLETISQNRYYIFLSYLRYISQQLQSSYMHFSHHPKYISCQCDIFWGECVCSRLRLCPHYIQCSDYTFYIGTPYGLLTCRHKCRIFSRTSGSILFLGYILSLCLFSARKKHRPFERCSLRT